MFEFQQTLHVHRVYHMFLELVVLLHTPVVVPPLQLLQKEEWKWNDRETVAVLDFKG